MNHVCIRSASKANEIFNFIHKWYSTHWKWCRVLSTIKIWLTNYFCMKDLEETSNILIIKFLRDHRNKILGLSQATYIDKILVKVVMHKSMKESWFFGYGIPLSKEWCPKIFEEKQCMKAVLYTLALGSLMYVMLCTKPDIYYAVGMVSKYQSNPKLAHWI